MQNQVIVHYQRRSTTADLLVEDGAEADGAPRVLGGGHLRSTSDK
jgi:hypothetical protein